ncbi:YaaL family protein [Alicyclobacillus sendaiensis]|uniref:YaaL family protein n=1 Tax=Alicyclobacillus sendaiensis TaxID=192387 RepID=UPI0007836E5C|nr:YaaL family protein [Alicyclobacillus sendaiensis]
MTPSDPKSSPRASAVHTVLPWARRPSGASMPPETERRTHPEPHAFDKPDPMDRQRFLREILKSWRELEIARRQFESVSDPLLIDHVVFRMSAAERQLNYLFRLAREYGISFDGPEFDWTSDEWRVQ